MSDKKWVFYIIHNRGATYAGVSPDPVRRLRQHNGEIVGGAKYTTGKGPGWEHICLVRGFRGQNTFYAIRMGSETCSASECWRSGKPNKKTLCRSQ